MRTNFLSSLLILAIISPYSHAQDLLILQYNTKNVTKISGTIQKVEEANWYTKDQPNLVARIFDQAGNEMTVDLGPENLHKKRPEAGQELVSKGCLVKVNDKQYFLSKQVAIDKNSTIKIRARNGVPVWIENPDKGFTHKMNRMKRMKRMRKPH